MKAQYRKVTSNAFTGDTAIIMREKPSSFILSYYLIVHPNADDTGIFSFETGEAYRMGLTETECQEALDHLIEAGFCKYDKAKRLVFLPSFTRIQFGEVKEKDSRIISVRRNAKALPRHEFTEEWVKLYGKLYGVKLDEITEYQYQEGGKQTPRAPKNSAKEEKTSPDLVPTQSRPSPDTVPTTSGHTPGKVFDPSGYDANGTPIKSRPENVGSNEPEEITQNDSPDLVQVEGGPSPDLGGGEGGLNGVLACESNQIKSNQSKNKQKENPSVGDGVLADATPPPDTAPEPDLGKVLEFLRKTTGYPATEEDLAFIVQAFGTTIEAKLIAKMRGLAGYDPTEPEAAQGFARWAVVCMMGSHRE